MKKIVFSLAIIAAVGAVVVGATTAYFSDTETSTGNTFAAGTLNLTVDGNDGANTLKFTVTDANPGASGSDTYTLVNAGTIDGVLDIEAISVTDYENDCVSAESDAGDVTCGDPGAGEGELSANLNIDAFWDIDGDGVFDVGDGDNYIEQDTLDNWAANYEEDVALDSGDTTYITFEWSVDGAVGNDIQTDSLELDLSFEMGQFAAQ